MRILVFICLLASCAPKTSEQINQTKSAFSERCKGVSIPSWQEQEQGADADKTVKLISELTFAAEADAKRSEDLKANAQFDINIKSDLARVINQNTKQSSKLTSDFWEQEIVFQQVGCLSLALLDNKRLSSKQKDDLVEDIRRINKAAEEYVYNKKIKRSEAGQSIINYGQNNGVMGNNNSNITVNPMLKMSPSDRDSLLSLVNAGFRKNEVDPKTGPIYVFTPSGFQTSNSISLVDDITSFLSQKGYNVQVTNFAAYMYTCEGVSISYNRERQRMDIIVCVK